MVGSALLASSPLFPVDVARICGEFVHLASRIEHTFPRFIDHYLRQGKWQLIINGDFIDFWNIVLPDKPGTRMNRGIRICSS